MPEDVHAYVTRAARQLGAPPTVPIKSPRQHIARCLDLATPGPSAFERRRRFENDLRLMRVADALRRNIGITMADAMERVGEDAGRAPESIARQARRRTNPG
jgi:hypothetical protein